MSRYRLTPYNQIDDYGLERLWKMNKQIPRKRKSQIASVVEVLEIEYRSTFVLLYVFGPHLFFSLICKQDALRAADFKEFSPETRESLSCWNPDCIGFNLIESLLCHLCENERPGGILVFKTGWDDISSLKDKLQIHPIFGNPNRVMLLACHGSMASFEQVMIITFSPDDYLHLMLVLLEYQYCS